MSLEAVLRLGAVLVGAYLLVLWVSAIIWVYRDVRTRTDDQTSQLVAVLLVAVFNVPGLLVYLVIRPQATLTDDYERSLETEALLHELEITANACQTCQRPVEDDFNVCPHCRTVLREACRNCGRAVRTNWLVCAYCAYERAPPRHQPAPGRAPPASPRATSPEPLSPPRRTYSREGGSQPAPAPSQRSVPNQ